MKNSFSYKNVSHLDLFGNRGTRELGNGLLKMWKQTEKCEQALSAH